jgi:hypothetical protein
VLTLGYTYPLLGGRSVGFLRFGGPGLGNCMLPWARSIVFARRHGLRPIWPAWPQVNVGPLLRREKDARSYFQFFRPNDAVCGVAKARLLATRLHRSEFDDNLTQPPGERWSVSSRGGVVIFDGMWHLFDGLNPFHAIVRRELAEIVRPEHRPPRELELSKAICVHVRRGDFMPASAEVDALARARRNVQIPIDWFCRVVKNLRRGLGAECPVAVLSDGSDQDLAELLALPGVRRLRLGSSLAEMLALAEGAALVASGSTFSMWGAFLGQRPTLWHRGQRRQRFHHDAALEPEIDESGEVPESFVRAIRVPAQPQPVT